MTVTGMVVSVGEHHRDDEELLGVLVEVSKDQLQEFGTQLLYKQVAVTIAVDGCIVERALRNARPHRSTEAPRWVAVMDTLGYGSTTARQLCTRFGLDPDERVPGIKCHCEED